MLRNFFQKLFLRFSIPAELRALLHARKASALRECLLKHVSRITPFPIDQLLSEAASSGWDQREREKLAAYVDFFSGNGALAYQRVVDQELAKMDFALTMTACDQCYKNDRPVDGYRLIKEFSNFEDVAFDPDEYFQYGGYFSYTGMGDVAEAIDYFEKVPSLSPVLVANSHAIYFSAGRFGELERQRQYINECGADDATLIFSASWVELARGFYPEGFRLAEARYAMPEFRRSVNQHLLPLPRWKGEPLKNRRILVHGEQGLGDAVMMARYLTMLAKEGGEVLMDVDRQAISLFSFNYPGVCFLPLDRSQPVAQSFDYWTGSMSLPYYFPSASSDLPGKDKYLEVPEEQRVYWKNRISELCDVSCLRIGVAWSGNPSHRYDRLRSIPTEIFFKFLEAETCVKYFTLQTSVPGYVPPCLIDCSEELLTLADTAALIEQMDLVISVDTSVVHLAGALGKKTWLLLPYRYEWRWGGQGEENNWYDSVRVVRQSSHGDWSELLNRVFKNYFHIFREEMI